MKNKLLVNQTVKAVLIGFGIGVTVSVLSLLLNNSRNELTNNSKTITTPKIQPSAQEKTTPVESIAKEIKLLKINPKRTIFINEIITFESERFADQILELGDDEEPIVVLIDSPGGSVFSGEKIVSAMEAVKSDVYTVCVGMCASMAAIIHQYGTKRFANDRAVLMFHDAAGMMGGRVSEMLSLLNMIKRKLEKTNHYIANRSKMSYEELVRLSSSNFWIDAEDAMEKGLVDDLVRIKR
jgi:ATP-dependent Clp protease protease subunit